VVRAWQLHTWYYDENEEQIGPNQKHKKTALRTLIHRLVTTKIIQARVLLQLGANRSPGFREAVPVTTKTTLLIVSFTFVALATEEETVTKETREKVATME
jgi:hypothetical protein